MSIELEQKLKLKKQLRLSAAKLPPVTINSANSSVMMHTPEPPQTPDERKQQIADMIARAQARKNLMNK